MRRSKRPKVAKKSPEDILKTSKSHFSAPTGIFQEGRYILGFDPGKRNLGWAIFMMGKYQAKYIDSGTLKVKGKPKTDNESILHLNEFLGDLNRKYKPSAICWENVMGGGISSARTILGEVQGIIKLTAYLEDIDTVMLPVQTRCMENLLLGTTTLKRGDKKIATCEKIKSSFPDQLGDRRVTKTGIFTHEADAIGCLYGLFKANDIKIEGVNYEGEEISTDSDEMH